MNETVLITGASSGIGYELAKLFAEDRCFLILVARNRNRLEEIRKELLGKAEGVLVIASDLTVPGAVEALAAEVTAAGRTVDILVNNAGFGLTGPFRELALGGQLKMVQLNIAALTELTYRFLTGMTSKGAGRIMNVASIASFVPTPLMSVYAATKAYVLSFSESLGSELAGSGVTVTALCPGPTRTNFASEAQMGELTAWFDKVAMTPAAVARSGYRGLKHGRPLVIPGGRNRLAGLGLKLLPRRFIQRAASGILSRLAGRRSK